LFVWIWRSGFLFFPSSFLFFFSSLFSTMSLQGNSSAGEALHQKLLGQSGIHLPSEAEQALLQVPVATLASLDHVKHLARAANLPRAAGGDSLILVLSSVVEAGHGGPLCGAGTFRLAEIDPQVMTLEWAGFLDQDHVPAAGAPFAGLALGDMLSVSPVPKQALFLRVGVGRKRSAGFAGLAAQGGPQAPPPTAGFGGAAGRSLASASCTDGGAPDGNLRPPSAEEEFFQRVMHPRRIEVLLQGGCCDPARWQEVQRCCRIRPDVLHDPELHHLAEESHAAIAADAYVDSTFHRRACLLQFRVHDWSHLSVLHFHPYPGDLVKGLTWGKIAALQPDRATAAFQRRVLHDALLGFRDFLVQFFGCAYEHSFEALLAYLRNKRIFDDPSALRFRVESLLAIGFTDLRARRSLLLDAPFRAFDTSHNPALAPAGAASSSAASPRPEAISSLSLLAALEQLTLGWLHQDSFPHVNLAGTADFEDALASVAGGGKGAPSTWSSRFPRDTSSAGQTPQKRVVASEHCPYHVAGLLGLTPPASDRLYTCFHPGTCPHKAHPQLGEITAAQATAAAAAAVGASRKREAEEAVERHSAALLVA
jgi:hypothetical protein